MRVLTKAVAEGSGELVQLAAFLLKAGDAVEARELAQTDKLVTDRVRRLLTKAAVPAGGLESGDWGEQLGTDYRIVANSFIARLAERSVFDFALASMVQVPRRTRLVGATLAASGYAVGPKEWKPISRLTIALDDMPELKAAAIFVASDELVAAIAAGGMGYLRNELERTVARTTDASFIGLLEDAAPTATASAGNDGPDVYADVRELLETTSPLTAESFPIIVVAPEQARRLATMADTEGHRLFPDFSPTQGGTIASVPARVSDQITADTALMFDAAQIAADPGNVIVDSATHAALQMNDDPSDAASALVSLWQTGSHAIRAERRFGAKVIGANAAAVISGVAWGESA